MRWRAALFVTSIALATIGAGPLSPRIETVKVSQRYPFAVCTGSCPNYDLQVRADGRVDVRQVWFDGADEYRHYRVSAKKAAMFFQAIDKLRPKGGHDLEETDCGARVPANMRGLYTGVTELEIAWINRDTTQHLTGCTTTERMEILGQSLHAIGLYADAFKIHE